MDLSEQVSFQNESHFPLKAAQRVSRIDNIIIELQYQCQ